MTKQEREEMVQDLYKALKEAQAANPHLEREVRGLGRDMTNKKVAILRQGIKGIF